MRRFVVFLTLIVWGVSLYAQSGNIEITNVEHGYVSNGQSGLNIHCKINLYNCKGIRTNITAFFYEGSNGENGKLYGGISGYRAEDGQVCSFDDVTPRYDSSVWEDYKIFIPYSAIPHENETHFSFYVIARNHNTSTRYAESDWSNFHFNNTSNNRVNQNVASNNNNNGNSTKVNLPNGGYTITTKNPDGTITVQTMTPCVICHGGKKCMVCYGTGGRYGYGGVYYPCASCAGLLYCTYCRGEGYQFSVSTSDGAGNVNTVSSDGSIASGNAAGGVIINSNGKTSVYGGGSSSSTGTQNRSANSSRVCSACGGRKYESSSYTHMPASGSGWAQPYHNSGGSVCSYCNLRTDHYHAPCSSCRGYGHN